jgi:hypothetical protein
MAFCSNCGKEIESGIQFCSNCGTSTNTGTVQNKAQDTVLPVSTVYNNNGSTLNKAEIFCCSCGNKINSAVEVFPKCGVNQKAVSGNPIKDKKGLAKASLVLGIIGSILGIQIIMGLLTTPIEGSAAPAILPYALVINIIALIFSIKSFNSSKKGMATAGLIPSIVGIVEIIAAVELLMFIRGEGLIARPLGRGF